MLYLLRRWACCYCKKVDITFLYASQPQLIPQRIPKRKRGRSIEKSWVGASGVASSISEGNIFIYSCSAKLISFEMDMLEKFWNVENVGFSRDCVVSQFEEDSVHSGTRYVAKLPFKPDHEPLPDNFGICEGRLKSSGADFLGGGVHTPQKFSSNPPEKFEIGVHIVSYYYYRLYLKKLIHLAVRVQLTDNLNKCNYYI